MLNNISFYFTDILFIHNICLNKYLIYIPIYRTKELHDIVNG